MRLYNCRSSSNMRNGMKKFDYYLPFFRISQLSGIKNHRNGTKCLDSIKGSFTNIFSPYSYIKHQIFDKYSHLTEKLYYTAFCRFCCALAEIKSNKIISRLFYILTLFIFSVFY